MGYWKAGKKGYEVQNTEVKETVQEIEKFPFVAYPERGISKATCERYGVRAGLSEKDGTTPEFFYFPSFNQKGKVVGYMRQDLSKDKSEKGHWTAVGSVAIGNKLFGQDVAESVNRKKNNLVITEGQWDCLSVYQSLVDNVKGTQYEGLEPFVVSIPLGTANAVEAILHNETLVKSHDALTIFFDDDYCTPAEAKKGIVKGHEAREAVAGALIDAGIPMFTIHPEGSFKDASDYMQAGKSKELAKLVQFGKRPFSAEKIVKASDISLEELLEPRKEGIYVNSFPKLMDKIHGFRASELVLLCAPSNAGKSTVTSFFASAFIQAGEKVGMIYLEETNKETLQRMVAAKLKVNYLKFKNNPLDCGVTRDQIEQAYNEVAKEDKLVMLGHFGSMPISDLMNKIKHMHLVEGCRYILLDHLSMVISGSEIENERKELDMVMTHLAAFCAANDVCVIAVSHLNRSGSDQFKPAKGQEDQPYWIRVTKEQMRGSASLEQLSFIVLGLEPQIMPDRSRGHVRLTVLKNRPWGYLGVADEFCVDEDTWEVQLHDTEEGY